MVIRQKNKARQIFRKTNISYPLIHTRTCAYQGVRKVRFSENLACFVFLKHPFCDSPFCLITDDILYIQNAFLLIIFYLNTRRIGNGTIIYLKIYSISLSLIFLTSLFAFIISMLFGSFKLSSIFGSSFVLLEKMYQNWKAAVIEVKMYLEKRSIFQAFWLYKIWYIY